MKKILLLLLVCVFMTGCGSDNKVKIGAIKDLPVTEKIFMQATGKTVTFRQDPIKIEQVFFEYMDELVAALQLGEIDEISTYEATAKYLADKNQDLEWKMNKPKLVDIFCFSMREEDSALKKEFDDTLIKMNSDGTLIKIVKEFMDANYHYCTIGAVEMPFFYDAPTIKIGFTGDLPPFELILDDGGVSGFDTAVVAEISERIGKNFEFVHVEQKDRVDALLSHKVDVLFWKLVPNDSKLFPHDFNRPAGIILTEPYFLEEIVHIRLRKTND